MKKLLLIALLIVGCDITQNEDCAGVPNGGAVEDACGVCDANTSNDCQNCSTYFTFKPSQKQAFYLFEHVTINGENINAEDTVAAFNSDICVGARLWDTDPENCGGGVCDVPVLGDNGDEYTEGYMEPGDIPTFKIYDVSEGIIYNATTEMTIEPWQHLGISVISTLEADISSAAPCKD